ncbi:kinase-like domain-containing protein [Absidia repens]|uniref:1-phosphatidylinositol 4-kinase n=1 Tax=Absidia repens TaxID=90262 RepID=A0A1X2HZK6_9FUNG|nr:kinase-like domain-containing protein [Absidia repens]
MSNDSLIRLFNSEFFDTWIAVSYLFKYYYNDDIVHYLCSSLKNLPSEEIEFFSPQLLHLLICKPTTSIALEDSLIDLWKRSPHFAVMCIWHLQCYLSDWSAEPTSPPYLLCQRILHKCEITLLMDNADHHGVIGKKVDRMTAFDLRQQRNIRTSSTVNMGQFWTAKNTQGSRNSNCTLDQKIRNNNEDTFVMDNNYNSSSIHDAASSSSSPHQFSCTLHDSSDDSQAMTASANPSSFSSTLEDLHGGDAFSLSRYIPNHMKWLHRKPFQHMRRAVSTDGVMAIDLDRKTNVMGLSSVPLNHPLPNDDSNTNSIEDDLSPSQRHTSLHYSLSSSYLSTFHTQQQLHGDFGGHHPLPQLERSSSPSTSSSFSSPRSTSPVSTASMKKQLSYEHQWSHSGYFQHETQFLVCLSDIAERLVALPKHSRGSALHAELTLLNHNLPANICLPLWCSGGGSSRHHRVMRVSPSDAVVLNSAERAPYLLMIEVLEDDMCLEFEGINASEGNHDRRYGMTDGMAANDDVGKIGPGVTAISPSVGETTNEDTLLDTSPSTDFSRQMRTAAVLLAQLQQQDISDPAQVMVHAIRQRVIDQMVSLEEKRMQATTTAPYGTARHLSINTKMSDKSRRDGANKTFSSGLKEGSRTMVVNKDDPSAAVLSEAWQVKMTRIRNNSPFGQLPNWRLLSVIVKQGADLRQEQFTIQLIREIQKIWQNCDVDAWVKYYRVLVTSENSGLIETIPNTVSVHSIKKNANAKQGNSGYTLRDFFKQQWGSPKSPKFKAAQDSFLKSLAGYSIVCYLLQIKDRHNGNLLLDDQGHLIHIDFGFVLSNSPGSVGFEMAPFKLSQEYVDVLGGADSELFTQYRLLTKQAFRALRKYGDNILLLVEMMSKNSNLPCFKDNPDQVLLQLRGRFQFHLTDHQLDMFVDNLISSSYGNLFTRLYDTYQYYSQVRHM